MFSDNPFSGLAATVPSAAMEGFVLAMAALVAVGTFFDMWHKASARYFFENARAAAKKATRRINVPEMASVVVRSTLVDILASGEFCNARRRLAHLLTMYGFLIYIVTTVVLVFGYSSPHAHAPAAIAGLWHAGALLVCLGGYWFWFFIRVDVVAEGRSPFRLVRADLFILSLLANATLALIWSGLQFEHSAWSNVFLALYLFSTIALFGTVTWSKFSHMFYKPAAAIQNRLDEAAGSRNNLPLPSDRPALLGAVRRRVRNY